MTLFTIGFTRKSAEDFFTRLQRAGVKRLLDTRRNPDSQLAGFAKRRDLPYFLEALAGIDYAYLADLAPTREMLTAYRDDGDWAAYERRYLDLLRRRAVETRIDPAQLDHACLLCSEATPERCHRRLAAEYLARHHAGLRVIHL